MTYQEIKNHIGRLKLLTAEFVRKSPSFEGDEELAKALGTEIANVEDLIYEHFYLALNKP